MTTINLSDLNYQSIRNSLLTYLKNQDTVNDLDFQGSAVNFLLDLLAYNTLYYAHFANMIAGESFLEFAQLERSIVSLVKPLGYTVPSKTASMARIKVKGISSVTNFGPYELSVEGSTPAGVKYQFWNIDDVVVRPVADAGTETDYFSVYEGNVNELSYGGTGFDYPNQEIFIPDLDLDINTLRVSVKRVDEDQYTYWKRLDVYSGLFIEPTSNLFSIERTTSGFKVKFNNTSSSTPNLVAGDLVNIKYISTSGTNANNCSTFKGLVVPGNDTITVVSLASSFGGLDSPNLTEVKRIAPLVFSAQQRVVTKDDYYAFLAQLGYSSGVNVWGGETNSPPAYGRVLFSIVGLSSTNNSIVTDLVGKLKERSVVTILPEYIPPVSMGVNLALKINYDPTRIKTQPIVVEDVVVSTIQSKFTVGSFNTNYTTEFVSSIINSYQGYSYGSDTKIKLSYIVSPSTRPVTLNFKNQIKKYPLGNSINSEYFLHGPNNQKSIVRDEPIIFSETSTNPPSIGKLRLFSVGDVETKTDAIVGEVNYKTGVVTIYPNLSSEAITIFAEPNNMDTIIAKDQVYLTMDITAETTISS
jgi:hypothetical protein